MGLHAREFAHHALELLPQNEARRRERHPFGATVEDGRVKLMLEFCNLPADRRCRNMKPFRGGPDRTRMRGLAEIAQRREIHGRLPALHLRQRNGAAIDMASTYDSSQCDARNSQPFHWRQAMPFMHMLPDPGMNYTFNRPLLDGTSPARLKELSAIAPRIKDYDSWHNVWLEVAKKAEAEKRWADAASYYHGAEFYLPAGDARNSLYDDFARNWTRAMQGVAGYERFAVPYPGGHLPGFRLQAKGKERSTFVFHGGYDSFVEEFYAFLLPLTELGFTVIAFDGPGQGGALRQGIYFEHAWEKPAKALLDYFEL